MSRKTVLPDPAVPVESFQKISAERSSQKKLSKRDNHPSSPEVSSLFHSTSNRIASVLQEATRLIGAVISESPRLDAEVLLADLLGRDRLWLHLYPDYTLSSSQLSRFQDRVKRRISQEPVAYIIGKTEFYSRKFICDRRALIPRPDTELIVEKALEWAEQHFIPGKPPMVLDLGTGSGILAITLAMELRSDFLVAIDRSLTALELTAENLLMHGLNHCIHLICSDWFSSLRQEGLFHLIVSNPPYISPSHEKRLQPNVLNYEPHSALFDSSVTGTGHIEHIFSHAWKYLQRPGLVLCEVGWDQWERVQDFVLSLGTYHSVATHRDLSGHGRVVAAEF